MSIENKLKDSIFHQFNTLKQKVSKLENSIVHLEEQLDESLKIIRNQLVRVKNGERLPDENIIFGRTYLDLSPEKTAEIYNQQNVDFFILDVSKKGWTPSQKIPEAINVPLEDLKFRLKELPNHSTPILVISEDGTRSILACEILASLGYHNINNISGGYTFWTSFKKPQLKSA